MGMDWSWDKSTPVTQYRKFGCPKCGAKHKYGHKRRIMSCRRCGYAFSPAQDARRYEDERLVNLTQQERDQALADINSIPPWRKKKHAQEQKRKEKLEQERKQEAERIAKLPLWQKTLGKIRDWYRQR